MIRELNDNELYNVAGGGENDFFIPHPLGASVSYVCGGAHRTGTVMAFDGTQYTIARDGGGTDFVMPKDIE